MSSSRFARVSRGSARNSRTASGEGADREVEINAANEFGVGIKPAGLNFHPLPFRRDEVVELVPGGGSFHTKPERSPITVTVVAA